jgi:hypothetical protein
MQTLENFTMESIYIWWEGQLLMQDGENVP